MKQKREQNIFLPDERPPFLKLVLYSFQQILVMFPATIAVALITGFPVSTTIFSCGLATICFILTTGKKVPLFCGSSFSYMPAIIALVTAKGYCTINGILPSDAIRISQFGILMSGLISILAGVVVKLSGTRIVEKLLPPQVTGSMSIVIGLSLSGNALQDIFSGEQEHKNIAIIIGLVTFLSAVVIATYSKGTLSQIPLLIGTLIGCCIALIAFVFFDGNCNFFRTIPEEAFSNSLWKFGDGKVFSLPPFTLPKFSLDAIIAIMPIAFATIPESVAHVYQLDLYVNELAKQRGVTKKYKIKEKLAENLIGDGFSDMVCGLIGGPAGTSYGENMSAMLISKVFSISVLVATSIILMFLSCFTPIIKLIYCIPLAVIGGLEIYLFGAIAVQGIAILIENKCNVFLTKNVAVIASMLVIGIGGSYAFNGSIPAFGVSIPAITASAIWGILLNLALSKKKRGLLKKS